MSKEPLRIIVADDNVDNADTMAAYLRVCGCDVVAVYHPLDIVSKAVEFEPHLIFLDIVMPGLDGYQVVTQLRATGKSNTAGRRQGTTKHDRRRKSEAGRFS